MFDFKNEDHIKKESIKLMMLFDSHLREFQISSGLNDMDMANFNFNLISNYLVSHVSSICEWTKMTKSETRDLAKKIVMEIESHFQAIVEGKNDESTH
jgi:hypothetical protein